MSALITSLGISIHAPLTGSDGSLDDLPPDMIISIHAPLTGSDVMIFVQNALHRISIHAPLTGSDPGLSLFFGGYHDFNPRSPYGERQVFPGQKVINKEFQSTLPLRGATLGVERDTSYSVISIHAPLTGSDGLSRMHSCHVAYFNPRSPYGERRTFTTSRPAWTHFNPRSPYGERPST